MQNPMLNLLGNQNQNNIMLQAVGAMMRGESPQTFLQNMAKTNPQLQGIDLNNLNGTAEQLCRQKGIDINDAKERLTQYVGNVK